MTKYKDNPNYYFDERSKRYKRIQNQNTARDSAFGNPSSDFISEEDNIDTSVFPKSFEHEFRDHPELIEEATKEYADLTEKYGEPIKARTRHVWVAKEEDFVIKMAVNSDGIASNMRELSPVDAEILPKTEPLHTGSGLLMKMQYVEPMESDDPDMPSWADFVDGRQVGRTKDGRIVAYDL